VIIDIPKFISSETPFWQELESLIDRLEADPHRRLSLEDARRFAYLYQRTSSDLARIQFFSSEQELKTYLESLVSRSYSEIHEIRRKPHRLAPLRWFLYTFPTTFRRHIRAFGISLLVTLLGVVFGGAAITFDPGAKEVLMPYSHLKMDPSKRVEREETTEENRLEGSKASFSSYLMTHNTKVSLVVMALGITWGVGTLLLLFMNGVLLGATILDYILAGESVFLTGWLLPHGSVEIPAILIAGQAGLVIAGALVGWNQSLTLSQRFRAIGTDLVTLIFGVAVLLVWAGIVEAFLSQYHEPVIPYTYKIGFGALQLVLLIVFLGWSRRIKKRTAPKPIGLPFGHRRALSSR